MPALEDRLAELATHPPVAPTPVTEIQGRARRRTRRRRAVVSAFVVVLVGAAALGIGVAASSPDPAEDVAVGGGSSPSSAPSSTTGAAVGPAGDDVALTLEPATGHQVADRVRVTAFARPAVGPAVVAQCASEAVTADPADVLSWCVDPQPTDLDPGPPSVLVHGSLATPDGVVACDDAPGRCVVLVALGDPVGTDVRWGPLELDGTPPASEERGVVVDGDEGTVGDGDTLLVTVTGMATGEWLQVQQCRTDVHPEVADPANARCDEDRALSTAVVAGPETQLEFRAFHDLGPVGASGDGWEPCEPCELVVRGGSGVLARVPLVMEPTDAPIRPQVALESAGPHAPGATVTVRASGLQPGQSVGIGWCPTVPPQGGGAGFCTGPDGGPVSVTADDGGAVVVDDFVLPGADAVDQVGEDCVATPGACSVGIEAAYAFGTIAAAPLDLTG